MKIRSLAWATVWILGAGCASQEVGQDTPRVGFPVLPPVEGADPAVRRKQTIEIPTQLVLKRDGNRAMVSVDERSFKTVEVNVGRNMIVGTQMTLTVLPEEERGTVVLQGGPPQANWGTSLEVGPGAAQVQARLEVFETDIPPQHMWAPTSGKYRVLGEWRLKASLTAR